MAVTYTTATLVRKRNKNISADLIDADLEQYIYEAETLIDVTMAYSFLTRFNATKHAIIRSCATDLAAFAAIAYDPGTTFLTLADAELTANLLWNNSERILSIVSNPRVVEYLRSV